MRLTLRYFSLIVVLCINCCALRSHKSSGYKNMYSIRFVQHIKFLRLTFTCSSGTVESALIHKLRYTFIQNLCPNIVNGWEQCCSLNPHIWWQPPFIHFIEHLSSTVTILAIKIYYTQLKKEWMQKQSLFVKIVTFYPVANEMCQMTKPGHLWQWSQFVLTMDRHDGNISCQVWLTSSRSSWVLPVWKQKSTFRCLLFYAFYG